jgi:Tol biopolymer transport system component
MKTAVVFVTAALAIALGATASEASVPAPIVFAADRAPTVSGEIYRVDANGHLVNLSRSPYADTDPVVSPSGKKVAFVRDLVTKARVYEVGIGGGHAVAVGPTIPRPSLSGCEPSLAWQPGTNRLAVGVCGAKGGNLWIVQPGKTKLVSNKAGLDPVWSPDGRVLVARSPSPFSATSLYAYSSSGSSLWHLSVNFPDSPVWSATDDLAVPSSTGLNIYNELGQKLSKIPGRLSSDPAWSRDGQLVAVIAGGRLTVKTPFGEGVLLYHRVKGDHALVWDGDGHVILDGYGSCGCKAKSIDIRTGRFTSASSRWFHPLSPNGKHAILTTSGPNGYAIQVAPTAGGAAKTYADVPLAYDDGATSSATSLQFVGSTRSLVYASFNPEPFSNLYAVSPGGGNPQLLAQVDPYAWQPAISPDGSRIAYIWSQYTGLTCKGCAMEIRVANADGSGMQVLTTPPDCTYDTSPTWSPDGATILYSEPGCDNPGELFTIPASGGTPTDLGVAGINPAWGPSQIAYEGALDTSGGIWTAEPDGSNPTKVASNGRDPAWSATGTLAYLVGASTVEVGQTTVHLPFASVSSLAWSPDGTQFVVVASPTKTGFQDVYTVKTDGTDPLRLTTNYDASSAS